MDSSTINDIQNCPIKCPKDLTKKIFVKDKQNYRLLFTIGKKAGESVRIFFFYSSLSYQ